jgi:hypothetical protein
MKCHLWVTQRLEPSVVTLLDRTESLEHDVDGLRADGHRHSWDFLIAT